VPDDSGRLNLDSIGTSNESRANRHGADLLSLRQSVPPGWLGKSFRPGCFCRAGRRRDGAPLRGSALPV